jgi:hypothetical protein
LSAREQRVLRSNEDLPAALERVGIEASGRLRLHLGCGEKRLDEYVNIDFPPARHPVQQSSGADLFADITTLRVPLGTVDEIRLHHVFEHFDRVTALAQLCRWHAWLRLGGTLRIETPDLDSCVRRLAVPWCSWADRQRILRHLFGSHEADWAIHRDGWSAKRLGHALGTLGFGVETVKRDGHGALRNVDVSARKTGSLGLEELLGRARALLRESLVDESETERRLYDVWCARLEREVGDRL